MIWKGAYMIRGRCLLLSLLCSGMASFIHAQADYQGLRLAGFDLVVVKQSNSTISLHCSVANTGRLPVDLNGKGGLSFPPVVVELDTLRLPAVLLERSALVQRALLRTKIRLAPGEIRPGLLLSIQLQDTLPEAVILPTCTDLVIDTAYLVEQTARMLRLRFQLQNTGTSDTRLFDGDQALALHVYFVSGNKLTRGAIFTEQILLKEPRELINGVLPAGATVMWEVEVSAKNRTRFSPHRALEFDPLQVLPDCGQRQRVWVIDSQVKRKFNRNLLENCGS